jgi:hypothetical protein
MRVVSPALSLTGVAARHAQRVYPPAPFGVRTGCAIAACAPLVIPWLHGSIRFFDALMPRGSTMH